MSANMPANNNDEARREKLRQKMRAAQEEILQTQAVAAGFYGALDLLATLSKTLKEKGAADFKYTDHVQTTGSDIEINPEVKVLENNLPKDLQVIFKKDGRLITNLADNSRYQPEADDTAIDWDALELLFHSDAENNDFNDLVADVEQVFTAIEEAQPEVAFDFVQTPANMLLADIGKWAVFNGKISHTAENLPVGETEEEVALLGGIRQGIDDMQMAGVYAERFHDGLKYLETLSMGKLKSTRLRVENSSDMLVTIEPINPCTAKVQFGKVCFKLTATGVVTRGADEKTLGATEYDARKSEDIEKLLGEIGKLAVESKRIPLSLKITERQPFSFSKRAVLAGMSQAQDIINAQIEMAAMYAQKIIPLLETIAIETKGDFFFDGAKNFEEGTFELKLCPKKNWGSKIHVDDKGFATIGAAKYNIDTEMDKISDEIDKIGVAAAYRLPRRNYKPRHTAGPV